MKYIEEDQTMNKEEMMSIKFDKYIKEATDNLKNYNYVEAYKFIMNAINENPNAPEPHNLLGIWYEFKGNNDLARKHYRIAYVLNPIYKPATVNLERVSTLFPLKRILVDFGEEMIEEIRETNIRETNIKVTNVKEAN
jgi:tetratricopeptide (TPR) repeat protein